MDGIGFEVGLATGICPVCRASVEDEGWTCPACDTRHHRECRDLTGHCAIYGCHLDPRFFRPRATGVPIWYLPPPRPIDLIAFFCVALTMLLILRSSLPVSPMHHAPRAARVRAHPAPPCAPPVPIDERMVVRKWSILREVDR